MLDKNELGTFMRIIRKERGLTQKVVAELADISEKTITNIEKGESVPGLDTALKLCDIYGIPGSEVTYFYKRSDCMEYAMEILNFDNHMITGTETFSVKHDRRKDE